MNGNPGAPWVHSDHVAAAVGTAYGDGLREGAENERLRIRDGAESVKAPDDSERGWHFAYLVPAELLDGDDDA